MHAEFSQTQLFMGTKDILSTLRLNRHMFFCKEGVRSMLNSFLLVDYTYFQRGLTTVSAFSSID